MIKACLKDEKRCGFKVALIALKLRRENVYRLHNDEYRVKHAQTRAYSRRIINQLKLVSNSTKFLQRKPEIIIPSFDTHYYWWCVLGVKTKSRFSPSILKTN